MVKRGWKGVQNGGQVACRSSQLLFELQSSAAFGLSNSANRCGCCTFFSVETARCFWSCTPLVHRLYTNITSYACTCTISYTCTTCTLLIHHLYTVYAPYLTVRCPRALVIYLCLLLLGLSGMVSSRYPFSMRGTMWAL